MPPRAPDSVIASSLPTRRHRRKRAGPESGQQSIGSSGLSAAPPVETKEPQAIKIPLCFDVEWNSADDIRTLREEISNVYTLLPELSFGSQHKNYQIHINMEYLLPLLNKAIDVNEEEPPRTREFRDAELRRVVALLEEVFLEPEIDSQ